MLTQRDTVSQQVLEELKQRASRFNLLIDDVAITHLTFSKEFSKAIEDKQVAEQNAERAKYVVQRAEQERQAAIIRSEGDAQAAQVVAQALQKSGDALLKLRRIETQLAVAETLSSSSGTIVYLPQGSNPLLSLPSPSSQSSK